MTPNIAERVEDIKRILDEWENEHYLDRSDSWVSEQVPYLLELVDKYQKLVEKMDNEINYSMNNHLTIRDKWNDAKMKVGLFDSKRVGE